MHNKLSCLFLLSMLTIIPVSAQLLNKDSSSTKMRSLKTTGNSSQELGIYNWFENYPSATVLTFDDYSPGHPAIGIPDLITHGLVGTFFITTNNAWRQDDYTTMKNAVTNGIEIGNHTISHPNLSSLNSNELNKEINEAYDILNEYVTNQSVCTFAYPFGDYNNNVIDAVKANHIAARIVSQSWAGGWYYNFAHTINDYYTIPTVQVNDNLAKGDIADYIEAGINDGGLITFMLHSIYNNTTSDGWFDAISQDLYNDFLDTIKYYSDKTWITTLANAVKYHKEANSATLEILSDNSTETILSLTDTLSNNSIYNHPLSIYYSPDSKSIYTSVKQNGIALPFHQNDGIITFNATPDGGTITLTKDVNTSVSETETIPVIKLYPVPCNGFSILEFYIHTNDTYSYKVTNAQGKIIYHSSIHRANTNELIRSELLAPAKGFYVIEIQVNNQTRTIKMIAE